MNPNPDARPDVRAAAPDSDTHRAADVPVIEVRGLIREYPGIRALDNVSLRIERGEVFGIVGENGAGKSTLMKILSGIEQPTSGEIRIDGRPISIESPQHADRLGIAMIHQELNLVDELSVAANIFLGRERLRGIGFARLVDDRAQRHAADGLLKRVNCAIDPARKVRTLSIAQQQLVEIAKALSINARVLIMDEPTAVLGERETESLMSLIRELRRQGVTVLFISHHLSEVIRICDRIAVLRDGRLVETLPAAASSERELASKMVGRALGDYFPPRPEASNRPCLVVRGLSSGEEVHDVTFRVAAGEILGFAGLIGAGRTEMGEAIVGLRKRTAGTIEVQGEQVQPRSPSQAARAGIAYLSEDRKGRGLTIDMGLTENTTMASLRKFSRLLINRHAEDEAARGHVQRLRIRVPPKSLRRAVRTLSGGNQQKVAIAKWLETQPHVLILDEPTRGVDVGAKREIYELITQLASRGMTCVFISSELPELLGVCHRIAVMRQGAIAAIVDAATATEEQIMHLAAGVVDVVGEKDIHHGDTETQRRRV